MRKVLSIVSILWFFSTIVCFSAENEIESEVLIIKSDLEFFIISSGRDKGVEEGDRVIVSRGTEKIAEAHIIEVRPAVSAAKILSDREHETIQEGDSVSIVKRAGPEHTIRPSGAETQNVISISISKDPETVFAYSKLILKENGFSITSSDRARGVLLANRPMELSLIKGLWADAFAAIDHKLVLSLDIKDRGNFSTLSVSSFTEYFQKGRHVKQPVMRYSTYYTELAELASKIKERSEY